MIVEITLDDPILQHASERDPETTRRPGELTGRAKFAASSIAAPANKWHRRQGEVSRRRSNSDSSNATERKKTKNGEQNTARVALCVAAAKGDEPEKAEPASSH